MKRTEPFHLISSAIAFQRKVRRLGYRTKKTITGNPVAGYGANVTYWKDTARLAVPA